MRHNKQNRHNVQTTKIYRILWEDEKYERQNRHTERLAGRQTGRQRQTKTDRQTETDRPTDKDRHTDTATLRSDHDPQHEQRHGGS